ncbi:MAG TPA: hypothetical protein PKX87_04450, partial [Alphaproteobacteria bacterium]|nr:hypothetical protein [Alphaproteobacteria bacterium]
VERDRLSGVLSGKAGTVERMAVVANPLLSSEGGQEELAELRRHLAEQFTVAREAFAQVQGSLESARTLAVARAKEGPSVSPPSRDSYYDMGYCKMG